MASNPPDGPRCAREVEESTAIDLLTEKGPKWPCEHITQQVLHEVRAEQQRQLKKLQEVAERLESMQSEILEMRLQGDRTETPKREADALNSKATCSGLSINGRESAATEAFECSLNEDAYEFKESIWSAAVFIFSPAMGPHNSAITSLLVIFTAIMQLIFCGLVLSNFTEPEFGPNVINGLQSWRLSIGHNLRYMEDLNAMSLVSRVCDVDSDFQHATLELSTRQASAVALIRDYLPMRQGVDASILSTLWSGPVLCLFALLCYYAVLVQEFHDIIRVVWAFALLPRGKFIAVGASAGLSIEGVSRPRLLFLVMTATFRAAIAGMLSYAGTLFIVHTTNMRDLLLNAVALAFVLEVDELLFASVTSVRIRNVIRQVTSVPLRQPEGRVIRQMLQESFSVVTMAIVFISLALVYVFSLSPVIQNLRDAEMAICGGRQNFVYAVDGFGTVSWTDSRPLVSEGFNSTHLKRALEEVIGDTNRTSRYQTLSHKVAGIHRLREAQSQTIADAADEGLCLRDSLDLPMRELFRDMLGDQTVTDCTDLLKHCDDKGLAGVRARQVCQRTCGCSSFVDRPLFHRDPQLGCGRHCSRTPTWVSNASSSTCMDTTQDELAGAHQNLVTAVNNSISFLNAEEEVALWQEVAEDFRSQGCAAIAVVHANHSRDLCHDDNLRPVLLTLCPRTCGCVLYPHYGCPLICFTTRYGIGFNTMLQSSARGNPVVAAMMGLSRRRRTSPIAQTGAGGSATTLAGTTAPLGLAAAANETSELATTTSPALTTIPSGRPAPSAANTGTVAANESGLASNETQAAASETGESATTTLLAPTTTASSRRRPWSGWR